MERGAVGSGAGTPGPGRFGPSDGAHLAAAGLRAPAVSIVLPVPGVPHPGGGSPRRLTRCEPRRSRPDRPVLPCGRNGMPRGCGAPEDAPSSAALAPRVRIRARAGCPCVRAADDAAVARARTHPDMPSPRSNLCVCAWPAAHGQHASTAWRRRALLTIPAAARRRGPHQPVSQARPVSTTQLTPQSTVLPGGARPLPRARRAGAGDCSDPLHVRATGRCATVSLAGPRRPSACVSGCLFARRALSTRVRCRAPVSDSALPRRRASRQADSQAFKAFARNPRVKAALRALRAVDGAWRLPAGRACPPHRPAARTGASSPWAQPRTRARAARGDRLSFTCPVPALRLTGVPSGAGRRARSLGRAHGRPAPSHVSLLEGSFGCRARSIQPDTNQPGRGSSAL